MYKLECNKYKYINENSAETIRLTKFKLKKTRIKITEDNS